MSPSLRGRRDELGTPRARFHMHYPLLLWLVIWVMPIALAAAIWVAGGRASAVVSAVLFLVLVALPLTWFLRRHQAVLTDRGLVYGAFVPGTTPEFARYEDIDLSTVRTWTNIHRYLRSAGVGALESGQMITPGARGGVTLRLARGAHFVDGRLRENEMIARYGGSVQVFALSGSPRRFVVALIDALRAAGAPEADVDLVAREAMQPGTLSGEPRAHLSEIPGFPAPRG